MRRREFMVAATGLPLVVPHRAARGQQAESQLRRVGLLSAGNPRSSPPWVAFDLRLRELGYVEGRNLRTEFRAGGGRPERFAEAAAEIMSFRPEVIVATGPELLLRAARDASRGIPIVMVAVDADPVASGLAASLARPGGNLTGVSFRQTEVVAKRLELLKEALPQVQRIGVLWDLFAADQLPPMTEAAAALGLTALPIPLGEAPYDFEAVFAAVQQAKANALLVSLSPDVFRQRERLARMTLERRIPAVFPLREFCEAGGLMSFGANFPSQWRRAAEYLDKVLRGARPQDLPIDQATTFEFVINMSTARTLGLSFPALLVARADEVIE